MSQPQTWLHFLTDSIGRSYVYQGGTVGVTAVPTWLKHGPDGWQDNTIKYARNTNYHELFRTFTTPYKYVKDGAYITRYLKYKRGSQEKLYHVIQKLNKSFGGGWEHKLFYRGQVDMSRIEDNDTSVTANIMEGGLSKFLNANENTNYELDIDVPDAVIIKDDGLLLKQKANFLVSDQGTAPQNGNHSAPLFLIGDEGKTLNVKGVERVQLGGSTGSDQNNKLAADQLWFYRASTGDDVSIEWDFKMTTELATGVSPNPGVQLFLVVRNIRDDGSLVGFTTLNQFNGPTNVFRQNHFSGSATITGIEPNTGLYLFMGINIIGSSGDRACFFTYDTNEPFIFNITDSSYRHRTTFTKGLRPMYVAQKLLDRMTGGGYQLVSNYIIAEWNNLIITSGDAIRGITGAKLVTSWRALFDSYNAVCNLSSGIRDQTMYIERKGNAYQQTTQLDLGAVNDMVVNDAINYQYGKVKVGFPNTDTEDLNGRDEFNVTVTYISKVDTTDKVLDLVSKYKASMYEQELLRINTDGKTTTDDSNDNTVYFKHLETAPTTGGAGEPATYYKYLRPAYTSVTGVIDPATAYNMELHPELCLKRHGNYLRGVFYWMDATTLDRETSDKNDRVVVMQGATIYIGNKNISVASFDPALFIPLTFTVNGPMPANLIEVMDAGPNGTFSFTYSGKLYYGFPLETGIQPVERPAQETTLLCSPATNLDNLITVSR